MNPFLCGLARPGMNPFYSPIPRAVDAVSEILIDEKPGDSKLFWLAPDLDCIANSPCRLMIVTHLSAVLLDRPSRVGTLQLRYHRCIQEERRVKHRRGSASCTLTAGYLCMVSLQFYGALGSIALHHASLPPPHTVCAKYRAPHVLRCTRQSCNTQGHNCQYQMFFLDSCPPSAAHHIGIGIMKKTNNFSQAQLDGVLQGTNQVGDVLVVCGRVYVCGGGRGVKCPQTPLRHNQAHAVTCKHTHRPIHTQTPSDTLSYTQPHTWAR